MCQPGQTPRAPRESRLGRNQEDPPSKTPTGNPQSEHQTSRSREEPKRKGEATKSRGRPRSGRTSRSASNETHRTGLRQERKGRNRTSTRGQTPERPSNQVKERPRERGFPTLHGGEERKKNSRPSQKSNPLTAGPAQHPRTRRIPAEGKPHRKTQEAKPPDMSPNSGKPWDQRGRTRPQRKGRRQKNHTSPRRPQQHKYDNR